MKKIHGEFAKELKESRGQGKPTREKFHWGSDFAKPAGDPARPKAKIDGKAAKKAPDPTSDIPRKVDGQIDTQELKQDLITQLKSQRKR